LPAITYISARTDADPSLMKPNPHLVWQALDKLGADPKRTILVGDSLTDIEAAKAAGVLAVGYANKPGKADRFAAAGEDRAAVIRMRRRGPGETVAPYRHRRDRPALRQLAADLSAWLRADLDTLEKAEPPMPVEDRAADTWEPLVAVADHAGHDWPDRARTPSWP
jgi:hypothetical protein